MSSGCQSSRGASPCTLGQLWHKPEAPQHGPCLEPSAAIPYFILAAWPSEVLGEQQSHWKLPGPGRALPWHSQSAELGKQPLCHQLAATLHCGTAGQGSAHQNRNGDKNMGHTTRAQGTPQGHRAHLKNMVPTTRAWCPAQEDSTQQPRLWGGEAVTPLGPGEQQTGPLCHAKLAVQRARWQ